MHRDLTARIPKFSTLSPNWRQPVENLIVSLCSHVQHETESHKAIINALSAMKAGDSAEAVRILEEQEELATSRFNEIEASLQYVTDAEDQFFQLPPGKTLGEFSIN